MEKMENFKKGHPPIYDNPAYGSFSQKVIWQKNKARRKNKPLYIILFLIAMALLAGGMVTYWLFATTPGWHMSETRSYYIVPGTRSRAAGFYSIDNVEYLFEDDGYLVKGWGNYNGETYYCDENGRRQYGIQTIQDERYLLDENGRLQTGVAWYQGNAYLADAKGRILTGWQEHENMRYWLDHDSGRMALGFTQLEDGNYLFNPETGAMQTNCFATQGENTYYLGENGLAVTGWQSIGGEKYYFSPSAAMSVGYQELDGTRYFFGQNGALMTGFTYLDDDLYYFGEDGAIRPCAQEYEGIERLFGEEGRALTGWQTLSGEEYYFHEGVRQTGIIEIEDTSYQLGSDGIFRTGWRGKSYYNDYGFALTGWQTLNGVLRHFDQNGIMSVNTTIGKYTIDGNGVAKRTAPAGGSVSSCYNYVRRHMRYVSIGADSYEAMVDYALTNGRGACYHYAALLHYVLANSGIGSSMVWGHNAQGGPHVWVQLGDGHILDACNGYYMITTDQMAAKGYTW